MAIGNDDQASEKELLALARKIATQLHEAASTPTRRLHLCTQLLNSEVNEKRLEPFLRQIARLNLNDRHYWIGTFYTLLLPAAQRRAQAAYFTPPQLALDVISLVREHGFDPLHHTVIDPSAGGAAFLSTLAGEMRQLGASANSIVKRLHGIEIDTGLARLSEALVASRLGMAVEPRSISAKGNALAMRTHAQYDLVIANPPYGRISLPDLRGRAWQNVCHSGHINKYALFADLCFRLAKPNGLIALVLPSSFIAGPLYDKLRSFIREQSEVLLLGSVIDRQDVFVDVEQDVSVLVARAGREHRIDANVAFGCFAGLTPFRAFGAGKLPTKSSAPWNVPASSATLLKGGATLDDYGVAARSGYFVWNRQVDRMEKERGRKLDFPLVWARNIKPGQFCIPAANKRRGTDFVRFEKDTAAIIRTNAIVMQRTTNSSQPRRLVAARIAPRVLKKWSGFVSENHTIVIAGANAKTLNLLCILLNSAAVDARYRRISGTASISVQLLRQLDLPSPKALQWALGKKGNVEDAIEEAYQASAELELKATA